MHFSSYSKIRLRFSLIALLTLVGMFTALEVGGTTASAATVPWYNVTKGIFTGARATSLMRPSTGNDWPAYLFNNGRSDFNGSETRINAKTAAHLKLHWAAHAAGAISAQPIEANNRIYWGSWDGYEHATNLNGAQIWATYLGTTSASNCFPPSVGIASTATVVPVRIAGHITSVVFVGGGNAQFYALNAATGKILWKTSLGSSPSHFLWSSPAVYQGNVYIGIASFGDCPTVQGQLVELNAASGALEHTFNVVPNGCRGGAVWSSPTIDTATGELYIATGNPDACSTREIYGSAVIKLHASNLVLESYWQVPRSEWVSDSDFGATPTLFTATIGGVSRALVGVAHKNGTYYALDRRALGNGPVWRAKLATGGSNPSFGQGSISSSAWNGHILYAAGGHTLINGHRCQGSLRALNPATGAFIWQRCLTVGPVLAAVTMVPGVVIVEEGSVVLAVNATSGRTLFIYKDSRRGSSFQGASSIADGMLYVGNLDGALYALGL